MRTRTALAVVAATAVAAVLLTGSPALPAAVAGVPALPAVPQPPAATAPPAGRPAPAATVPAAAGTRPAPAVTVPAVPAPRAHSAGTPLVLAARAEGRPPHTGISGISGIAGDRAPVGCGSATGGAFPIATRLYGGPDVHHTGAGFEPWAVELANTTGRACREVHPVLVFAARDRGLTPARMMLEFYDPGAARWRTAPLEATDEDEVVAVLGTRRAGGGGGFTVAARSAVTVKVRLALTGDTPPNQVTVNAAVVQRRGDDGDWVGESGDYRFAVLKDRGTGATVTRDELATTGTGSTLRLAAALGMVLGAGGVLVLLSRGLRRARG
ncbi:hypothetical protein ACWDR0_10190 [Streptomyces sp. NPDC003691]